MRRIACLLVHESTAAPSASRELLLGVALAHSPRVEEGGADHVYLDATGLRGLFGSEEQLARRLVAAGGERGQRVRVGIAGSRISARFACRLHEGITVVEPEDDAAYLAPAPVALLDLPPEMATRLDRWGIGAQGRSGRGSSPRSAPGRRRRSSRRRQRSTMRWRRSGRSSSCWRRSPSGSLISSPGTGARRISSSGSATWPIAAVTREAACRPFP